MVSSSTVRSMIKIFVAKNGASHPPIPAERIAELLSAASAEDVGKLLRLLDDFLAGFSMGWAESWMPDDVVPAALSA